MKGRLERVLEHDAEHRTAYAATLRAYLDAFGDVAAAAAASPSTQHLPLPDAASRRVFEVDLANPEERLVLELQFRLLAQDGGYASAGCPSRRSS